MYPMFQEYKGLKSLDLSNFNTKKETKIYNIFKDCKCDLIFKYYTLRGCDELVLNKKENANNIHKNITNMNIPDSSI